METEQTQTHSLTRNEERLSRMMKALGNPVRMQIILYMRENPQCITGDIVEVLPIAQATVSQHLKVLRDAGLICGTTEGPAVSYCLDVDGFRWLKNQVNDLIPL